MKDRYSFLPTHTRLIVVDDSGKVVVDPYLHDNHRHRLEEMVRLVNLGAQLEQQIGVPQKSLDGISDGNTYCMGCNRAIGPSQYRLHKGRAILCCRCLEEAFYSMPTGVMTYNIGQEIEMNREAIKKMEDEVRRYMAAPPGFTILPTMTLKSPMLLPAELLPPEQLLSDTQSWSGKVAAFAVGKKVDTILESLGVPKRVFEGRDDGEPDEPVIVEGNKSNDDDAKY